MEKIMRSMAGMPGAPGMKRYSKDNLLNMKNFGDEDGDEDNEDDDGFPSKLGKVLRDKESTEKDWKQRIVKGLKDTGAEIKRHVNKASGLIQEWWRGKKAASGPSKAPRVGTAAHLRSRGSLTFKPLVEIDIFVSSKNY